MRSLDVSMHIKNKREVLGLSQADLAIKLGWLSYAGPQSISNVERGNCQFPLKHVKKLCEVIATPETEMIELLASDYRRFILNTICTVNQDEIQHDSEEKEC